MVPCAPEELALWMKMSQPPSPGMNRPSESYASGSQSPLAQFRFGSTPLRYWRLPVM